MSKTAVRIICMVTVGAMALSMVAGLMFMFTGV